MRELKFRAWIPDNGLMLSPRNLGTPDSRYFIDVDRCGVLELRMYLCEDHADNEVNSLVDDAVLMQFAGLRDMNGKEIYEADIVQYPDYYTGDCCVEAGKETIQWDINGFNDILNFGYAEHPSWVEVIGNIYEHPHLLETKS